MRNTEEVAVAGPGMNPARISEGKKNDILGFTERNWESEGEKCTQPPVHPFIQQARNECPRVSRDAKPGLSPGTSSVTRQLLPAIANIP